ncbi:hypothetical protein ACOMHN_000462 [Nucella lapillus]
MSKKERRLESKKKKSIALLNLIETKALKEPSSTMEEPRAKKARLSDDTSKSAACAESPDIVSERDVPIRNTEEKEGMQVSAGCESETTDEQYARARQVQRQLQKEKAANEGNRRAFQTAVKFGPKIQLCLENMLPFTNLKDKPKGSLEERLPPVFIVDLQHLLLLALLKNFSFWTPRWCRLMRPRKLSSVVLVVVKGVSIRDLEQHPDSFPFLTKDFLSCVEMVNPVQYHSSVEEDICRVPLLISQLKCYTKREDIRQKIVKLISKPSSATPAQKKELSGEKQETRDTDSQTGGPTSTEESQRLPSETKEGLPTPVPGDSFPRTSLLLSSPQLMEEGYPLPVDVKNNRYSDYVFSEDSYLPVTPSSPMFGVDCEMCQTAQDDFELTRVSVVNEAKEVIYDELVKPYSPISNYLTPFSGMTAEKLSGVTKRLEDVHKDLKELLPPDAILCGQSLWNDLNALKMFHPYVIDTSIIFNQSGDKKVKCGLRKLAFNFLRRKIQDSNQGHCSIEDAKATIDLVKLKLSKNIEFGDALLGGVYFPNIKTYFQDPSKAQNVEEVFSARSTSSTNVCDHSSSRPSSCLSTDQQNKSCVCSQIGCTKNNSCAAAPRTNGSLESEDCDVSPQGRESLQCGDCKSKERREGKAACEGGLCEGVRDQERDVLLKEGSENSTDGGNQREAFFQQEGSTVMVSFFELLADNHNTAGIIGNKELFSRLQPGPKVHCMEAGTDSEACSAAVKVSQDTDFTWVELKSCAEASSGDLSAENASGPDKTKHLFAQLDNHVQDLVSKLERRSLIAVMLTGRSNERQHFNAATFLKIT